MRRCWRSISALANIGLDLIGQATHFLGLPARSEGKGRDADALAFHRDVLDFTQLLLVEQPNGDFAQTIARQFLFSTWQELLFAAARALAPTSRSPRSPRKAVKEVAYHAELRERMGRAPGRRHRGEPRAHDRRARLDVALRRRVVRDGRSDARLRRDRRRPPLRDGMRASRRCWPKRRSNCPKPRRGIDRRPRAAIIASISAICCREMQFLQRTYPDATMVSGRAIDRRSRIACCEVLAHVPDPEIPVVSVVDLGIVREVDGRRGHDHADLYRLPGDAGDRARHPRRARSRGLSRRRRSRPCSSPPWTTDWISEEGRRSCAPTASPPPTRTRATANVRAAARRTPRRSAASARRRARRYGAAATAASRSTGSSATDDVRQRRFHKLNDRRGAARDAGGGLDPLRDAGATCARAFASRPGQHLTLTRRDRTARKCGAIIRSASRRRRTRSASR